MSNFEGSNIFTLTAQGSVSFISPTTPNGGMLISAHVANTATSTWAATLFNITGTTTATNSPIVGYLGAPGNGNDRRNYGGGGPVVGLYVQMTGNANLDFEVLP